MTNWPPIIPFIDSAGVLRPTARELLAAQRVRDEDAPNPIGASRF